MKIARSMLSAPTEMPHSPGPVAWTTPRFEGFARRSVFAVARIAGCDSSTGSVAGGTIILVRAGRGVALRSARRRSTSLRTGSGRLSPLDATSIQSSNGSSTCTKMVCLTFLPAFFFGQYPRGGVGTRCRSQILANVNSFFTY